MAPPGPAALCAALLAASLSLATASNTTLSGRKLLGTPTAPCPPGGTCVANYGGTTFTSPNYYLSQTALGGAYQWNTPQWTNGVCTLQCTSMVNCKGVGGNCVAMLPTSPGAVNRFTTVDCNYVMFGTNYCAGGTGSGPGSNVLPAYCSSGGAGTPMTVLCTCPAPSASQYVTSPCTGCQGSTCSGSNTIAQCTPQCPAGSFTTNTCGLGTVLYQPNGNGFGGGGFGGGGPGGGNGGNPNCACANNPRMVAMGNCPCATTSPPPPSPSPPPPSPAYMRNQGNGNGNQVGHDTVCQACSTCGLGFTVSAPCVAGTSSTLGSDTQCSKCAAPPANAAFTAAGSCAWKCSDGFMASGSACVKSPVPSPPMPPPPPPKVYTSTGVVVNSQKAQNVFVNGPNGPHKLNGGATSTSTDTLVDQVKNTVDTTSTTAVTQIGLGNGHVVKSAQTTDTTATMHPVIRKAFNSPPPPPPSPSPPPPTVYPSSHVAIGSTQLVVDSAPTAHVLNNGATTTSTDAVQHKAQHKYVDTTTTLASQQGTGNGNAASAITTTTDSTTTTNPVVNTIHNTFPSTTDMKASTEITWSDLSSTSSEMSSEMWGNLRYTADYAGHHGQSDSSSTTTASLKANGPLALLGPTNVPVSYFSNYQGMGVPNAPYVLSFSTGTVYNVGTQYFIGNMMTATENCNEFTVPVTGGAGPCPNGAMRKGTLTITCGADQTDFNVDESTMCTYLMTYVTSQACPPGTQVCGAAQTATITAAAVAAATPAPSALCGGSPLQISDMNKNLCLHVKGTASGSSFTVSGLKRPVITMPCVAGSPNQMFTASATSAGGVIIHVASGQQLSTVQDVSNGAIVTLAAPGNSPQELWQWQTPTVGGMLVSVANTQFEITDNRVNAGASVGLPVHLWHLYKSLPSGAPKAQWAAQCSASQNKETNGDSDTSSATSAPLNDDYKAAHYKELNGDTSSATSAPLNDDYKVAHGKELSGN